MFLFRVDFVEFFAGHEFWKFKTSFKIRVTQTTDKPAVVSPHLNLMHSFVSAGEIQNEEKLFVERMRPAKSQRDKRFAFGVADHS